MIWRFRLAILVAVSILFLIASGSAVTGNLLEPLASPPQGLFSQAGHQGFSVVASVLAMALAIWLIAAGGIERRAGLILGLLVLAEGALGTPSWLEKFMPTLAILHAVMGQLLFAGAVAAALLSSPGRKPEIICDAGWPSLRSLSLVTPLFTLTQIFLGAAFRHKALGVMPHIAGAIVVALLILLTGMFVTQQCSQHRYLKPAAVALMTMVFIQVFLGIAALTARMINSTDTPMVLMVTGAHVVVGALTLGANVALSLEIRTHVIPKPVEAEA
jgi:hypothetical protein